MYRLPGYIGDTFISIIGGLGLQHENGETIPNTDGFYLTFQALTGFERDQDPITHSAGTGIGTEFGQVHISKSTVKACSDIVSNDGAATQRDKQTYQ
jgi:hypothetical protein